MQRYRWHIMLGLTLLSLSVVLYLLQIAIFHRPQDTWFYLLQDLAFLPVQILLVTLVISEMLSLRARYDMLHKMNMVIGAFFTEVGTELLKICAEFDTNTDELRPLVHMQANWDDQRFAQARREVAAHNFAIDHRHGSLGALREMMLQKRQFLLGLLENPNLLEHESFTELLWAVTHLCEELSLRSEFANLPAADYDHLATDIKRAYSLLLLEWLKYCRHLRKEYPFIYSLVVRSNPFDPEASVVVKD